MNTQLTGKKVASIGDLVTDIVMTIPSFPVRAAENQIASRANMEPGGAGNFLITGSRLGMCMDALGVLGRDEFGEFSYKVLREEGVLVENIIRQPGSSTTTVIVLVDQKGNHVFVGKYGEGENLEFPESWKKALVESDAVFSYGYTLVDRRLSEACLDALAFSKNSGKLVFFDPGPDLVHCSPAQRKRVLQSSSCILVTEDEIPNIAEGRHGVPGARQLLQEGPDMVCVKRGEHGCIILTPNGEFEHSGFSVPLVDTTGAGDSFDAAFIFGRLLGWELEKVALFSNAVGAAKVQKLGSGRQVPTRQEIFSLLENNSISLEF